MTMKTKAKISGVGGTSVVTGEITDTVGPGIGKTLTGNVVFVCDSDNVKYKSAKPKPYKKKTDGGFIELWWQVVFKKKSDTKKLQVKLDCKRGAKGPTRYAWTVTVTGTPKSKNRFNAMTGVYYHDDNHSCA